MPTRLTGAKYAQARRDAEKRAKTELRALIPRQFFSTECDNEGKYNDTAKVLAAAKAYLEAKEHKRAAAATSKSAHDTTEPTAKESGKTHDDSDSRKRNQEYNRVIAIQTSIPAPFLAEVEEVQQMRQAARRLVQTVEDRAKDGLSEELRRNIDQANDLLIDMINVVEQEGWTEEQKRKYQALQAEWETKAVLQR